MKYCSFILLFAVFAGSCQTHERGMETMTTALASAGVISPEGSSIGTRYNPPAGFHRLPAAEGSYTHFLRQLSLKPHGAKVHYYDGRIKENVGVYAGVLNMDVGTKDLQQCADAVMRLRAEYLFASGRAEEIHFNLTNGFRADFAKWMQGYRIVVSGRNASWRKTAAPASDHGSLRNYLDFVYSYAGSLSLSRELKPVVWRDMQPGDILIFGGSPGHAETVTDMAVDGRGKKVFLLSQSYMPAQEIQILENPSNMGISPWYELWEAPYMVQTPEYSFRTGDLMGWADN
jgi:hypothetical protein